MVHSWSLFLLGGVVVTIAPTVASVAGTIPETHYSHHGGRGHTPMRSNPLVIHRELTLLDVHPAQRVCEIGTGSGYSGALLSSLVGEDGRVVSVVSVDIDPYLVQWARCAHRERGVRNVRCVVGDGRQGFAAEAPYDRLVAWCTPPHLPKAWVDQSQVGGVIVTPLPVARVPQITVVAEILVDEERTPRVQRVLHGGYMETVSSPCDPDTPTRLVDWEYRLPSAAWRSVGWRKEDNELRDGARGALDRLLARSSIRETVGEEDIDWGSWRTWAAATDDHYLTAVGWPSGGIAVGHSTPESVAVLRHDGTILADRRASPSLRIVRDWFRAWDRAGRPAVEEYEGTLHPQ